MFLLQLSRTTCPAAAAAAAAADDSGGTFELAVDPLTASLIRSGPPPNFAFHASKSDVKMTRLQLSLRAAFQTFTGKKTSVFTHLHIQQPNNINPNMQTVCIRS